MTSANLSPRIQPVPAPSRPVEHDGGCLAYGISENGGLVHVENVLRGLACNCRCASCGAVLVARQGTIRNWHFAHHDADECAGALETTLHLLAKRTIMESREILLPAAIARHEQAEEVVANAKAFTYDTAREEVGLGSIRPDVVITKGERELLVEIAVTHFCDSEKIAKLRDRDLPAIEIDLSSVPRLASHEQHVEQILSAGPRAWLHNAKILAAQDRLRSEADKRLSEEFACRSASWRAEVKRHSESFRKPVEKRECSVSPEAQMRREHLQLEAFRAFGDASRARAWLQNKHTSLGAAPIEACLTSRGMVDCLGLLFADSYNNNRFSPRIRRSRRL